MSGFKIRKLMKSHELNHFLLSLELFTTSTYRCMIFMIVNALHRVIPIACQSTTWIASLLATTLFYRVKESQAFSALWNRRNVMSNLNMIWVKRKFIWPLFAFKNYQKGHRRYEPNFPSVRNISPIQSSCLQNFNFWLCVQYGKTNTFISKKSLRNENFIILVIQNDIRQESIGT